MNVIKTMFSLFNLNVKLLFSNRFFYFILGIILYFGIVTFINYLTEPGDQIVGENVYIAIIVLPFLVLTVFLSSFILPSEMENNTIESLFSISGSIYKVWLIKIAVMYVALSLLILFLEILTYFMITDFKILNTYFQSLFPLYFTGGMTFYFAVRFRSNAVGAILSGIVLLMFLFLSEPLYQTKFYLYLNPMENPRNINGYVWSRTIIENRIGMVLFGSILYYLGLSKVKFREKFIQ